MNGRGDLAGGLVLILLGVWLFTRTWWGHLPAKIAEKVKVA